MLYLLLLLQKQVPLSDETLDRQHDPAAVTWRWNTTSSVRTSQLFKSIFTFQAARFREVPDMRWFDWTLQRHPRCMFSRCALTCPAGCRSLRRSPTGSGWPLCDLLQPPRAAPTCRRSRQRSHPPRTGSTCRPPEKKRRAESFKLPDQCFSFSFRHVSALTFPQRSKHTKHKVTSRCLCCSDPQTSLCVTLCHFASFVSQSSVFLFRRSELKNSYLLRKALMSSAWFSVFRPRRRCSLCFCLLCILSSSTSCSLSRPEVK